MPRQKTMCCSSRCPIVTSHFPLGHRFFWRVPRPAAENSWQGLSREPDLPALSPSVSMGLSGLHPARSLAEESKAPWGSQGRIPHPGRIPRLRRRVDSWRFRLRRCGPADWIPIARRSPVKEDSAWLEQGREPLAEPAWPSARGGRVGLPADATRSTAPCLAELGRPLFLLAPATARLCSRLAGAVGSLMAPLLCCWVTVRLTPGPADLAVVREERWCWNLSPPHRTAVASVWNREICWRPEAFPEFRLQRHWPPVLQLAFVPLRASWPEPSLRRYSAAAEALPG